MFWHRTLVYWGRKEIRNNVKIYLDQNKERLILEANNLVKGSTDVKLSVAEINCLIKIKWDDELPPDY